MRDQDRQAKLLSMVIQNFIPEEERIKVEDRCHWDEDENEWKVELQHLTGNSVRAPNKKKKGGGGGFFGQNVFAFEDVGDQESQAAVQEPGMKNVFYSYPTQEGAMAYVDENVSALSHYPLSLSSPPPPPCLRACRGVEAPPILLNS